MNGFLIFAALGQWNWHLEQLGTANGSLEFQIFTDSRDYPVVVFKERLYSKRNLCFWWEDTAWKKDTLPSWKDLFHIKRMIDRNDSLWIVAVDTATPYLVRPFHGKWDSWDTIPSLYLDGGSGLEGIFPFLDTSGIPTLLTGEWGSDTLYLHRFVDSVWAAETLVVVIPSHYIWIEKWLAAQDHKACIHILAMTYTEFLYGTNETGIWDWEIIDSLPSGDFVMSGAYVFIDSLDQLHVLYNPYIYGQGYEVRYIFRDTLGLWHMVDSPIPLPSSATFFSQPVVDQNGIIHFGCADKNGGLYHWHKVAGQPGPWTTDLIKGGIGEIIGPSMTIDNQNYLHIAYYVVRDPDPDELWYGTTAPNITVAESSPEPKSGLVLIPASQGFWITSHSGLARIYDPAGRLVLKKDIKGKTLISPLRPEVYFVVAGEQRARVVVN